jgi:serine/threonine protein kinase
MTSERWRCISRIYFEASRLPVDARDKFIHEACDGDSQLEREVRSLVGQPPSDSVFEGIMQPSAGAALDATPSRWPRTLGRFEVRGLLGVGGMGEVYRAHDPALGRDVAVKLLPAAFTGDAERLARFEREARILAALSHPQIAAIYGIEDLGDDGDGRRRALVLELVEGETLAERLHHSRLSIREAIGIARQIGDGLEAAHDKGVVHRDLKPANINVRADGVVKILDFGLAKAEGVLQRNRSAAGRRADAETANGVILGTPAYMSPEQARGETVDRRTDTWAFGCVLFEMLTGQRPFAGETPADTIAAVLEREPDWTLLPPTTPDGVRRLLRRCLEKNSPRRLRDMGDARLELEEEPSPPPAPRRQRLGWIAWVALGGAVTLTIGVLIPLSRPNAAREHVQFTLLAPDGYTVVGVPIPSPDGRRMVFSARSSAAESALWVRAVDSTVSQRIPGTERASNPFWSPDGRFVGFSVDNVLKRTAIAGGAVQRVADLDPVTLGATWNRDDVIVFAPSNQTSLYRVAAGGGRAEPLTSLNRERRENSHRWPYFLPDGRHFIFTARSDLPQNTGIYAASLDAPESPTLLVTAQSAGVFVPPGFLLFVRDDTLLAQRFDAASLVVSGNATAIAGNVGAFAASADGRVLTHTPVAMTRLAWFDRSGTERTVIPVHGRRFSQVRVSPDESRAAVMMADPANHGRDVWVVALSDGSITRVTSHPSDDWFPAWSPDGSEVIFGSQRNDTYTIYAAPATGGGNERQIYKSTTAGLIGPTDWSRDGRLILFHSYPRADINVLPMATPDAPVPVVTSRFTDWVASFSPNGRWIAYMSDESGQSEVYVRAVDQPRRYRISLGGGSQPRWRRDGRELFFIGAGDRLYATTVRADTTFQSETPSPLFQPCPVLPGQENGPFMYRYDVGADGTRTLWTCPEKEAQSPTVAVHALSALLVR